jgi:hypothetical protein
MMAATTGRVMALAGSLAAGPLAAEEGQSFAGVLVGKDEEWSR